MLWHWQWANQIVDGNWLGEPKPFFRAPLYPYFLALLITIFGKDLILVRIGQALVGSLSSVFGYLIAEKLGLSKRVCLMVSLAIALYPLLLFYDLELQIPVLIVPLNLAGIFLLLKFSKDSSSWKAIFPGIIFSFSLITRPDILTILPAVIIWSIFKFKSNNARFLLKFWLWFGIGFFSLGSIVFARNWLWGKEPVFIATQGGVNFWIGNNEFSDGKTSIAPGLSRGYGEYIDRVWLNSRLTAEAALGRSLSESEVDKFWQGQGLKFWWEKPGSAIKLFFRKGYYLLNGEELSSNEDVYYFQEQSFLIRVLLWKKLIKFPFGLLLPLALAGLIWARKNNPDLWLLALFALFYGIGISLFFITARFRVPLIPVLIIISGLGISSAIKHFREKNWFILISGLAIFFISLFISNSNYAEVNKYDRSRNYIRAGNYYYDKMDLRMALQNYSKAIELYPNAVEAYLGLGNVAFIKQKYKEALDFYITAELIEPNNAMVQFSMALVYINLGNLDEAERRLEWALWVWPEFEKAKKELEWLKKKEKQLYPDAKPE